MASAAKWGLVTALGVVAALLIAWILWPQGEESAQTRQAEQEGVTVLATLLPGDDLRFTVVLDTHTVPLADYDVVGKVRLETDLGALRPTGASQRTDTTGHHVEATLVFAGPREGRLTLVVEDLAGVAERRLEFTA